MQFSFPSLISNQYAFRYVADSGSWSDYKRLGNFIHLTMRRFDTFGDGLCAHAPDMLVQKDQFADYISSLVSWISDEARSLSQREAEIQSVVSNWPTEPSATDIEFLRSVKWAEGKTRYYNLRDNKISSSDSKRHDKRWNLIEEWQDGSCSAIYRALCPDYSDGTINRCIRYEAVRTHLRSVGDYAGECMTRFFEIQKLREDVIHDAPEMAFDALQEIIRGWKHIERSNFLIERLKTALETPAVVKESA